jgi:hypothetical protein
MSLKSRKRLNLFGTALASVILLCSLFWVRFPTVPGSCCKIRISRLRGRVVKAGDLRSSFFGSVGSIPTANNILGRLWKSKAIVLYFGFDSQPSHGELWRAVETSIRFVLFCKIRIAYPFESFGFLSLILYQGVVILEWYHDVHLKC